MRAILLSSVFSESFFSALSVTSPDDDLIEEILALAEGTGLVGRLFYRILGAELRGTKHGSCLFRTESMATAYVQQLLRRYCSGFLDKLEEIINSACLASAMEEAASHAEQDEGLQKMLYLSQLVKLIDTIVIKVRQALFSHEGDAMSMRSLLSAIGFLTDTHIKEGSRSAMVNTLFLRCVCPLILKQLAVANMQSEGSAPSVQKPSRGSTGSLLSKITGRKGSVSSAPVQPHVPSRRTLLMLSRALQTLANGTALGEDSLEGLKSQLEPIRPKMTALFDDIHSVEFQPDLGLSTDCTLPFDKQLDLLRRIMAAVQGKMFGIKTTLRKLGMQDTLSEFLAITKTLRHMLSHPDLDEDIFRALFQKGRAQSKLPAPGGGLYASLPENTPQALPEGHAGCARADGGTAGRRRLCTSLTSVTSSSACSTATAASSQSSLC
mmetsp:Transcript_32597/g.81706  ORF Transcript_32597/g.81706 Transcript_32597/m.81706 type:complete len:437 (-) Transcript_32597:259-1569(-)